MKGIITLCGSHRFKETFEQVAQELGLSGWVVLRPAFAKDAHEYAIPTDGKRSLKQRLDDIHFEKIAMSQAIVVINQDKYIGQSTKAEIAHARKLDKLVYWYDVEDYYLDADYRQLVDAEAQAAPEPSSASSDAAASEGS